MQRAGAESGALADPGLSDPSDPMNSAIVEELLKRWRLLEPARRIQLLIRVLDEEARQGGGALVQEAAGGE